MEDHEMCNEGRALLEEPYSRVSFFASSTIILYGLLLASVMFIFHVVFQRKNEKICLNIMLQDVLAL